MFKGESGEIERKADATCLVKSVFEHSLSEEKWPRLQTDKQGICDNKSASLIKTVYQGQAHDNYGEQAVIGTLAICLKQIKQLSTQEEATELATSLWNSRDKNWLNS